MSVVATIGVTIALLPAEPDREAPSKQDDNVGIDGREEETRQDVSGPVGESRVAATPVVATAPDDETVMARLRGLMFTAPATSLEIARDGNTRFPDGPHGAERAWFETRALVLLGRFDEARSVARRMVERYPNADWTTDVRRHLLRHPTPAPP